jgi:DNA-binding response OmpR family regulator
MQLGRILWVDDEVDSLQSQQIFLTQKGYEVITFTNGYDAVEYFRIQCCRRGAIRRNHARY